MNSIKKKEPDALRRENHTPAWKGGSRRERCVVGGSCGQIPINRSIWNPGLTEIWISTIGFVQNRIERTDEPYLTHQVFSILPVEAVLHGDFLCSEIAESFDVVEQPPVEVCCLPNIDGFSRNDEDVNAVAVRSPAGPVAINSFPTGRHLGCLPLLLGAEMSRKPVHRLRQWVGVRLVLDPLQGSEGDMQLLPQSLAIPKWGALQPLFYVGQIAEHSAYLRPKNGTPQALRWDTDKRLNWSYGR